MKTFLNAPENWGETPKTNSEQTENNKENVSTDSNRIRIETKIAEIKADLEAKFKK